MTATEKTYLLYVRNLCTNYNITIHELVQHLNKIDPSSSVEKIHKRNIALYRDYAEGDGKVSLKDLGKKYGISAPTVASVIYSIYYLLLRRFIIYYAPK